jgi:hypothetical protein
MTTTAQVKKMVRPLLERHSDLALVGRWIYVKPVHHFARAVLIDRTSAAHNFAPQWVAVHLFEARTFFPLSWATALSDSRQGHWWSAKNDPDVANTLVNAIEEQALPRLRAMKTLDDYLHFVSENYFRHHLYEWPTAKIIVDVALGELTNARSLCDAKIEDWSTDQPYYNERHRAEFRRLRELCACLRADDRPGLARLLHSWEAETVKTFKIEHLWEPTPFPLETVKPT